ncbi:DNA glycosylase [Lindgomyces ingoldianus]|uniref:DNA glycosylase n=1 Tax=Lindgomyces ingoldianus TaxID=673940 RepID=A0ACB6QLX8_9PLEO|nr:DNA glycosylase [Lindgomyces ingoldianus]KAF2467120.1 DNA glycosylase [Lindgomyces ingoldianus]
MSLRRSARISTRTLIAKPETNFLNVPTNFEPKKRAAATKKRKNRASAASTAQKAEEVPFLSGIIKPPEPQSAIPEVPVTPVSKRPRAAVTSPAKLPPFTPTPSGVGLIASTVTAPFSEDGTYEKSRPTEPHTTNAPLSTSGGSRVVAYTSSPIPAPFVSEDETTSPSKKRKAKAVVPPDVGALRPPTSTIDTLLKDACEHLCSVDPKLKALVNNHHCKMFSPDGLREVVDPFTALASGIIGQQVSGQAAASIRKKFTGLFEDTHPEFPSPAQVIQKDLPTLRTAGLSQRKAEYIQGLAEKFASGELNARMLINASDEDLIEKLVAVRGLGRWSVEMFACFGLKRMDVFSTGDLGVQRGMATYMGRDVSKLKGKGGKWKYMSEKEMLDIAAKFSPYRSLFMWYMWRIENVDISVMQ